MTSIRTRLLAPLIVLGLLVAPRAAAQPPQPGATAQTLSLTVLSTMLTDILASIADVILSHHHLDHTGGLIALRKALAVKNPAALSRAHVAAGMFSPRRTTGSAEANPMVATRLAYARTLQREVSVRAVIGGLHLFTADERHLAWTAERMRAAGVTHLLGAHCTGIEALYRLRALADLTRDTAVVSAVGSGYDDAVGLRPGRIAR